MFTYLIYHDRAIFSQMKLSQENNIPYKIIFIITVHNNNKIQIIWIVDSLFDSIDRE